MQSRTSKQVLLYAAGTAALSALAAGPAFAVPVAYWRFETGPAGTNVIHTLPAGQFEASIADDSGNGNTLSVWEQGGGAGYQYRSDLPFATVPKTGATNNFSVKNTGGGPAMFTDSSVSLPSGVNIETMTPSAFTIEVSWKPETGGFRTVLGRDAQNVATSNAALAALYFQARPDNSVGVNFTDVLGNTHEAFSPAGFIQGFNFATDPDGLTGTWYNLAAVSDGSTLKVYANGALIASTSIVSADPRLAVGTTSGGDWHAGEWSVGRGLFNGNHVDRAYGFIDEVRISDSALTTTDLLVPITSQLFTWTAASGSFENGANWDKGTPPIDFQFHQALINNNGTALIGGSGSFNVSDLWVGSGSSGVGHVTQTGATMNVRVATVIAQNGGTGDYDMSGGTLNTAALTIAGIGPGANTATMTVHGNAVVNVNGGQLNVGGGGGTLNAGVMTVGDSAVVNIAGGQSVRIGNTGTGTFFLQDTAQLNTGTSELWVGNGSSFSHATANVSGGSFNVNNWLAVGRDRAVGTLNLSGGTVNKTGNGNIVIGAIGTANGTVNQTGGQLISVRNAADAAAPGLVGGEVWVGESTEAKGTWNFSAGTASAPVVNVGYSGQGSLNISGTAQLTTDALGVARAGTFGGVANLNGGSIHTGQIFRGGSTGPGQVNFNGTTIVATADNDRFVAGFGTSDLVLQTGGAVINTNGRDIGIDSGFSGSGPLIKNGSGVLTLNAGANNTYSGNTVINTGTLRLGRVVANNSLLASNVSAFYRFDDAADLGKDSSPNGNHVTDVFGTAAISSTTAPPSHTMSLSLPDNQTNQNFLSTNDGNVPSSFPLGNSSYTIAAWINVDGTNTNQTNGIVGWGDLGATPGLQRSSITFRTQNNGGTPNGLRNSWFVVDTAANLPAGSSLVNQWHHVVAVYDANTDIRRIYVDGTLLTSGFLPGINNAMPQNFRIGMAALGEAFSGNMADLLVTRSPLTPAQIQELMNNGMTFGTFVGGTGALSANSLVQIASGATLDLNGASTPSGGLGDIGGPGGLVTNSAAAPAVLGLNPVGSASFSGIIQDGAGMVGVSKTGPGTQILAGANTYTGTTVVNGGTLQLNLAAHGPVLSSAAPTAFADIQGSDLVFNYTGGSTVAPTVLAILDAGYDLPDKFSDGDIRSTTDTALIGLGWRDNTGAQQVHVKRTWYGDADLNGQVDVADLGILASNWQTAGNWAAADFDYSGFIDVADLGMLASNWQAGVGSPLGPSLAEALASLGLPNVSVPEPAALGAASLGVLALRRRRRSG
jgi:MYXO-CTERM domain-containing protein